MEPNWDRYLDFTYCLHRALIDTGAALGAAIRIDPIWFPSSDSTIGRTEFYAVAAAITPFVNREHRHSLHSAPGTPDGPASPGLLHIRGQLYGTKTGSLGCLLEW